MPQHFWQSRSWIWPRLSSSRGIRQSGQSRWVSPEVVGDARAWPQWGQNLEPKNARPKQDGQEIVARRVLQYGQEVESGESDAPQEGQFRVAAAMSIGSCEQEDWARRILREDWNPEREEYYQSHK